MAFFDQDVQETIAEARDQLKQQKTRTAIESYADDVCVGARTQEDLERAVLQLLTVYDKYRWTASPKKCQDGVNEVELLGHRFTPEGVLPPKARYSSCPLQRRINEDCSPIVFGTPLHLAGLLQVRPPPQLSGPAAAVAHCSAASNEDPSPFVFGSLSHVAELLQVRPPQLSGPVEPHERQYQSHPTILGGGSQPLGHPPPLSQPHLVITGLTQLAVMSTCMSTLGWLWVRVVRHRL